MKQNITINTWTYDIKDGYRVDITVLPDEYEAYIYHKDLGMKRHMLGISRKGHTFDEFKKIIEENIDDNITFYTEDIDVLEQHAKEMFS